MILGVSYSRNNYDFFGVEGGGNLLEVWITCR